MAVGLFITIFLLFHRISSSNSRDEGSSSIDTVHPINLRSCQRSLSKTQQELVEARGKICELCERPTKIGADLKAEIDSKVAEMSRTFSALKADFERELNETREKNAEVERELRSENTELRADLYVFQSRNARKLNETMEENAEVERKLRSESMELKAELATKMTELRAQIQSERENKTAEIAKLQADLNRTTTFLELETGWSYWAKTASWYKVIEQKMTFDEAEAYCGGRKSHLVTIHSQEANDFVWKLANTLDPNAWFWIGLKRNWNERFAFEWTDGSSVDFDRISGEPNWGTHALVLGGRWAV
uniref:C-type lectin domain-containing protein n=1 Tax=Mesorhabditis belari TaxID=2138241 RepID=A0AAF3FCX5_9BILA